MQLKNTSLSKFVQMLRVVLDISKMSDPKRREGSGLHIGYHGCRQFRYIKMIYYPKRREGPGCIQDIWWMQIVGLRPIMSLQEASPIQLLLCIICHLASTSKMEIPDLRFDRDKRKSTRWILLRSLYVSKFQFTSPLLPPSQPNQPTPIQELLTTSDASICLKQKPMRCAKLT